MFLALMLAIGGIFLCANTLQAETVVIKKGDNPWTIHLRFTDNGNDFRYSEYRRTNPKTGKTRVLFRSQGGRVTRNQFVLFRRLWPGDEIIIPDTKVKYTQINSGGKTVAQLCRPIVDFEQCTQVIADKNLIRNINHALPPGLLLIPKKYEDSVVAAALNKNPVPSPAPPTQPLSKRPLTDTGSKISPFIVTFVILGILGVIITLVVLRFNQIENWGKASYSRIRKRFKSP